MSESSEAPAELARFHALAARESQPNLEVAERNELASRWLERAQNELATSYAFLEVARALEECGAPEDDLAAARAAIDEERAHASIGRVVAEHYAGTALTLAPASPVKRASFRGADARQSSVLYVAMQCALGESIAAAYLGRCLESARTELTREAVRTMLADEVRHARLGFRFLAGSAPCDRELVQAALPSLFETVLAFWLDERRYPPQLPPGHGCLGARELRESVRAGLEELVLPGFEHVGIDVGAGRAFLERRGYFGRR